MFFVWSQKRINVKLAWWGPSASGKTQTVHALARRIREADEAADERDTLGMARNAQPVLVDEGGAKFTTYFCHPFGDMGRFAGYPVHYQLKTPEPPLEGNAGFEKVLNGISGVVFVADTDPEQQDENRAAMAYLVARLSERHGVDADGLGDALEQLFGPDGPLRMVVQANRTRGGEKVGLEALRERLELPDFVSVVATNADRGEGVMEVFETMGAELRPLLEAAQERGRIPEDSG